MAHRVPDRARDTSTTTGTGDLTVSGTPPVGYRSFSQLVTASLLANGDTIDLFVAHRTLDEWEVGTYTYSATNTLQRTAVKASSNAGAAVNFSAGTKDVVAAAIAARLSPALYGPLKFGGRPTLESGVAASIADQPAKTTVYYSPKAGGGMISVPGEGGWLTNSFAELSQATTDATKSPAAVAASKVYDLLAWIDAGVIRVTRGAVWASDTSRGTGAGSAEVDYLDGMMVNKVAVTNGPAALKGVVVGTIRSNASSQIDLKFGSIAAGGGEGWIGICSAYNRVPWKTLVVDSTDSWSYSSATWRAADNSSTFRVSYVSGLAVSGIRALYSAIQSRTDGQYGYNAVKKDATNGFDGTTGYSYIAGGIGDVAMVGSAIYQPDIGFHYISAVEASSVTGLTFGGDFGNANVQTGLIVEGEY